jgi:hypothetical protein
MNLPIYVLYRPERRARAQAELTKLGWQAAFVEGPPALSAAEAAAHWPSWVDPGCTLPGGQIACHVGHARVLERVGRLNRSAWS